VRQSKFDQYKMMRKFSQVDQSIDSQEGQPNMTSFVPKDYLLKKRFSKVEQVTDKIFKKHMKKGKKKVLSRKS